MHPPAGLRLTLVVPEALAWYSGMVPGLVAGHYAPRDLSIDAIPLARRAGAAVILAAATGLDPACREIALSGGRPPLRYDLASFDIGAGVLGDDLPGVREHALRTRPLARLVGELEAVDARLGALGRAPRIVVVGAGAAGVELACAFRARLRARSPELTLVDRGATLLASARPPLRRRVEGALRARAIALRLGVDVAQVEPDALRLAEGDALPADLVVWATGAAPHGVLAPPAVATDPGGFALVRDTLQLLDHPDVFAAGDCAVPDGARWVPRAGVYAVRAAGVLAYNLEALVAGRPLLAWRPQREFLTLLNLGDGAAIASKWGLVAEGPAMMRWKDRIDRRFIERFRVLDRAGALGPGVRPMPGADAMVCGGCAAKLGRTELERALGRLPPALADPSVRLGAAEADDAAAVTLPGGDTVVASVDGFRAFCEDDWLVGRVAAVNAVTDLHATGAVPRWALATVTLREADAAAAREDSLVQLLAGARATLDPLGVALVGGHTTVGPELAVGFAVLGALPEEAALLPLGGFAPGDRLLLTKPLGTGALLAAHRQGRAAGPWLEALEAALVAPQAEAMALARAHGVRAATDITGFGLAGHALEVAERSGVTLELRLGDVPLLPGALAVTLQGIQSTFQPDNARALRAIAVAPGAAAQPALALLFDPQTAGGLLLAAPADRADALLAALRAGPSPEAADVGAVGPRGAAPVVVSA